MNEETGKEKSAGDDWGKDFRMYARWCADKGDMQG